MTKKEMVEMGVSCTKGFIVKNYNKTNLDRKSIYVAGFVSGISVLINWCKDYKEFENEVADIGATIIKEVSKTEV